MAFERNIRVHRLCLCVLSVPLVLVLLSQLDTTTVSPPLVRSQVGQHVDKQFERGYDDEDGTLDGNGMANAGEYASFEISVLNSGTTRA